MYRQVRNPSLMQSYRLDPRPRLLATLLQLHHPTVPATWVKDLGLVSSEQASTVIGIATKGIDLAI